MTMLNAYFKKYSLKFKVPGGTSRGVLHNKDSWFIIVYDKNMPDKKGIGECSIIRRLSIDDRPDFEVKLKEVIEDINNHTYWLDEGLAEFPAIRFGLEMAMTDLRTEKPGLVFHSEFTSGAKGIPINGLIWMGDVKNMYEQVKEKVSVGFDCIKLKIGAINFEDELVLLKKIRKEFSGFDLELRVDANGAFKFSEALEKLKRLSDFQIHSIEQPIKQGQWEEMAYLCLTSPIPIALDEELIGIQDENMMGKILEVIRPQYIILKPSLLGGFKQSDKWIEKAVSGNIGWWVTSALESNVGLNAIAQWTATLQTDMYQGLGTGQLFENNIASPLSIKKGSLHYGHHHEWNLKNLTDG
jgi:o-succinylbenzoate synthase